MPFTPEQEKAINDQGKDILVSASAGSGKTTVLVERVLREILGGTGVDRLLIVTFTKAAAEEMKERIKSRLSEEAEHNARQRHYLREQLHQIDTANISTIDAFCLQVIHRFYYAIDLDPSFSVLTDETQTTLLKERALKEVEEQKLAARDKDFLAFYNNFAGDRDAEAPRTLLLDLYDYASAKPDYASWLKKLPQEYETGSGQIEQSPLWQKQIKPYLRTSFQELQTKINNLLANPLFAAPELVKARAAFVSFSQHLAVFVRALNDNASYDHLRQLLHDCQFTVSFKKAKKWDQQILTFYQRIQTQKAAARKQVFAAFAAFFAVKENEQKQALVSGKRIAHAVVQAELALIHHFSALKREQNLIDYDDMEQMAYAILSQDTSNSQLARDFYRNQFKEILVDEYQDINPLQEKIIQLLKKQGKNTLFMVGDVKQSIYGFRQAEPSLFLQKYREFGQNPSCERILLAANFRSTKAVTKSVNHLFNPLLSKNFGGIDYRKEAQLVFGARYYPPELPTATEVIYHAQDKQEEAENAQTRDFAEIQMVIDRIKQFKKENFQVYDTHLQRKRPLAYRDIAILTRSRTNNLQIMQAFAKNNLPLFVSDAENYFQTFELTVVMDYLKIIDNPDQDIPLVTVLRSPLFNFKEKDLTRIRLHRKNCSFYNALLAYVALNNKLSRRVKIFLNELEELRAFSTTHRISELIWSIYERTSVLEIMTALPNGQQRRINLEALYERATSYESAGFKGLYQFINFIERMRQSKKDLAQPLLTKEAGDAVRLMTIHGAKGLEFPVVFLIGLEHHYQMRDLNGNYVIQKNSLGLTIRQKHYRLDTLVKSWADVQKKQQLLEEEARILYVAITRAKQKLLLVADIPHFTQKVNTWQQQFLDQQLPLADKMAATSPLSFFGPAFQFQRRVPEKMTAITSAVEQKEALIFIDYHPGKTKVSSSKTASSPKQDNNQLLTSSAQKLFSFVYPFRDASRTTAYQAVSEIKKAFNDPLDKDLENARLIKSSNRYLVPIDVKPHFLFATKFSGAEIGTATHLLLQYYPYRGRYQPQLLRTEIDHLVATKKLDPAIVASIKLNNIAWFVQSEFARPFWAHPERLHREVDFSSLLAAKDLFAHFSDPEAKILVHGTIDGYYQDKNRLILFDYKTDYVDPRHLALAVARIKAKYTGQLRLYAQALQRFSGQKVTAKYLILLDAQKVVKVD